jgi:hypothetical protein
VNQFGYQMEQIDSNGTSKKKDGNRSKSTTKAQQKKNKEKKKKQKANHREDRKFMKEHKNEIEFVKENPGDIYFIKTHKNEIENLKAETECMESLPPLIKERMLKLEQTFKVIRVLALQDKLIAINLALKKDEELFPKRKEPERRFEKYEDEGYASDREIYASEQHPLIEQLD